jgi:hypothetical protein
VLSNSVTREESRLLNDASDLIDTDLAHTRGGRPDNLGRIVKPSRSPACVKNPEIFDAS